VCSDIKGFLFLNLRRKEIKIAMFRAHLCLVRDELLSKFALDTLLILSKIY
jgi:hypothetical protein